MAQGIIYACFNYCLLILNYFLPKFSYSENIPLQIDFLESILALFYFSCSSPMDFNQVSDLKIEPVYVGNLSYFDIPAKILWTMKWSRTFLLTQDFHVFRDDFFRKKI
jgi:hypothetical protein